MLVREIERVAVEMGASPAFSFPQGAASGPALSYAESFTLARELAEQLRSLADPTARVLLLCSEARDFVVGFLATLLAEMIAVPAVAGMRGAAGMRTKAITTACHPDVIVASRSVAARYDAWVASIPELARSAFLEVGRGVLKTRSKDGAQTAFQGGPADGIAFLQYTSGSVAAPKGVIVTPANVLANVEMITKATGLTRGYTCVSWLPLYHDMGLIGTLLHPLLNGAHSIILDPAAFARDPYVWLAQIAAHRATVSVAPNFAYELCCSDIKDDRPPVDLSSWRLALNGSEPVSARTLQRFSNRFAHWGFDAQAFVSTYGLAEATLMVSANRGWPAAGVTAHGHSVSCGQPCEGLEVMIVDPERRSPRPDNEIGEVWVRGPSVAAGYWNAEADTTAAFGAELANGPGRRYLRTGDLGVLASGDLFIVGRLKDTIIVRGRNVCASDVEAACHAQGLACAGERTAAIPMQSGCGEKLIVLQEISPALAASLCETTASATCALIHATVLASLDVAPDEILLVRRRALPRTTSGKIRRQAIAPALTSGAIAPVYRYNAADHVLRRSADTTPWCLDQPAIRQGMDSLAAARFASVANEALGLALTVDDVLSAVTLRSALERAPSANRSALQPSAERSLSAGEIERRALAYNQERLWLEWQLEPDDPAYNLAAAFRIDGPLSVRRLTAAFRACIERHATLRTLCQEIDGRPVAVEQRDAADWAIIDLGARSDADAQDAVALLTDVLRRPFDLGHDLPVRVAVLHSAASVHYIGIAFHHIAVDGRSLAVLAADLRLFYETESPAGTAQPPPYSRYIEALHARERRGATASDLQFWRDRFATPVAPIEWRDDPVAEHAARVNRYAFEWSTELLQDLESCARTGNRTLFTLIAAAYWLVLARRCDSRDLAIGVAFSGRATVDLHDTVGFFVNSLPIRISCDREHASVADLLDETAKAVREAFEHQHVPFHELLGGTSAVRRNTGLQTLLVLQPERANVVLDLGQAVTIKEIPLDLGSAKTDLSLNLRCTRSGISGIAEYSTRSLSRRGVAILIEQLHSCLCEMVRDPALRVATIAIDPPADPSQPVDSNAHGVPDVTAATLIDMIAQHAERNPTAIAAEDEHSTWSYRSVIEASLDLEVKLQRAGVGPAMHVAVFVERSAAMPATVLGIWRRGATAVLLDETHPKARLKELLQRTCVRAAVTAVPLPEPRAAIAEHLCQEVGIPLLRLSRTPSVGNSPPPNDSARAAANMAQAAYVVVTSGTTGDPKCVVTPLSALTRFLAWQADEFRVQASDRFAMLAGLGSDPLLRDLFAPLWSGARMCVPDEDTRLDGIKLRDWLIRTCISVMHITPTLLAPVVEPAAAATARMPRTHSLRIAFAGGDQLTFALAADFASTFPGADLVNSYGTTETPQIAAFHRVDLMAATGPLRARQVPIGRAVDGFELQVVTADGAPAARGESGEISVRSRFLATGEIGSEGKLLPVGMQSHAGAREYRTGDFGFVSPSGDVILTGRRDRQVKIRGHRVCLEEIETVVAAAVGGCRVLPEWAPSGEPTLVAYVVPKGDAPADAAAIRSELAKRVPEFMLPARFVILESFPISRSGKVDLQALPTAPQASALACAVEYASELEREIADVWRSVLGSKAFDRNTSFVEAGGHSLLAVRVAAELRKRLDVEIRIKHLYALPTIAGIAAAVENLRRLDAMEHGADATRAEWEI